MKKALLVSFVLCLLSYGTRAQYFTDAVGLRLGSTSGITYKHFTRENNAFEIMGSGRNRGIQVTALYEKYLPLKLGENFFIFYGIGAHTGVEKYAVPFEDSNGSVQNQPQTYSKAQFVVGIDGMFGFEYRPKIPLTFGVDFKPYFQTVGFKYADFNFWDFAFSAKFIL